MPNSAPMEPCCASGPAAGALAASEYQCSICCELLLDPVVGSCGHDFCKGCLESWQVLRHEAGLAALCPLCRAHLLPPTGPTGYGVCIRLRETVEKLFPELTAARKKAAQAQALHARSSGCFQRGSFGSDGIPTLPSSSATTSSASDRLMAEVPHTRSSTPDSGSAAVSPSHRTLPSLYPTASHMASLLTGHLGQSATNYSVHASLPSNSSPLLNPQFFTSTAERYRELSYLVASLAAAPMPAPLAVGSFLNEAGAAVERVAQREACQLLSPQQAQGTAQNHLLGYASNLFADNGAYAQGASLGTPQPSLLPQAAAGSRSAAPSLAQQPLSPALQAALALLTSAAATSTAADQLSALLTSLQAAHTPLPAAVTSQQALPAAALVMHALQHDAAAANVYLRQSHSLQMAQAQQQAHVVRPCGFQAAAVV